MSTLVVIQYDDRFKAEEMRLRLLRMQKEHLVDLEDAVVAVPDDTGKIKLHQAVNFTALGAVSGGYWGCLIGLIFLSPLLGTAMGVATGVVTGALRDVGIDDEFMKGLAQGLPPRSSALFVLVKRATPDLVLDEVRGSGGKILKTSLSHENEATLQAALSAAMR